jgi:ribonuclease HII
MVKGDARFASIAAASILAKTERDQLMSELHQIHPAYGWDRNQGYPTLAHRSAIAAIGPSPFHRMTFQLLPLQNQLALFD